MDPVTLALVGGSLGLLQGFGKQKEAERQRKLQGIIAQYSPWTGMSPDLSKTQADSPLMSALGPALLGYTLGGSGAGSAGATGAEGALIGSSDSFFKPGMLLGG